MKRAGNYQGHIRRLPSGKWNVQVMINGRRESITAATKGELNRLLAARLLERSQGNYDLGTTYETYLKGWLESKRGKVREKTWSDYEALIRNHIVPALGSNKLKDLKAAKIQAFYDHSPAGKRTLELCHSIIHQSLQDAFRRDLIPKNYADQVDPPRPNKKKMAYWTEDQLAHFLAAARGHRFEHAWALSFITGMRSGEVLGLAWADVDFSDSTIFIHQALKRNIRIHSDDQKFEAPKTEAGIRRLRLGPAMMERLKDQLDRQETWRRAAGETWKETGMVFTTTIGTYISASNFRRDFLKVIDRAGLPVIRIHDARHTAVSLMRSQGISLRQVSAFVGHASENVTREVYSHVFPDEIFEISRQMDNFASPPTPVDLPKDE